MTPLRTFGVMAGMLPALLAGCGSPVAKGADTAQTDAPTIVSLNPCTDAILAEMAGPEQLLAISHYSHDPRATSMDVAKAQAFGMTGGTVEEVLALSPDMVVAGSFMPPATRAALADLGIRVETFDIASSVDQSIDQVRRMASISGHEDAGEELVTRINAAVTAMAAPAGSTAVPTVLWQPSGIVPGEKTLIGELMRGAGFSSHSAASGMGQADFLPLEMLLANPPRVLLLAGQERSQHHPALAALPEMQRAEFDPALLYCGGPTIIRAANRLREIREAVS
ncbi:ABC transporter substrate-binding protein [Allopontixanthobacter confluentis]